MDSKFFSRLYLLLLLMLVSSSVTAGSLKRVKDSIGSDNNRSERHHGGGHYDDEWDDDADWLELVFEGMFRGVFSVIGDAANYSFIRAHGKPGADTPWYYEDNIKPRRSGDASLANLQAEVSVHNPWGDTFDVNYGLLLGYGAVAFKLKQHHYWESSPLDDFELRQQHLLVRLSFGNHLEIHQGIGNNRYSDHEGKISEEFSYTSPILFKVSDHYQLEFTPTWSNSVTEYDLSLNKTDKYYSLKLGYRHLHTAQQDLSGFYLGLALHY